MWRAEVRLGDPHATAAFGRLWRSMGAKAALLPREIEVLQLTAEGLTVKEIAGELGVSFHTAAGYRKRAILRLGARNKTHAVAIGITLGLIA